jgi:hypothetical protein
VRTSNLTEIVKFPATPEVEQSFSRNLHFLGVRALAFGAKRSYLALTHRHLPMLCVVQPAGKD